MVRYRGGMRGVWVVALVVAVAGLSGCHSAYIEAVVHNRTGQTLPVVEVDYPSASFGTSMLPAGQDYHYRFKVLGSGQLKLVYTDAAHAEHTSPGPALGEGDEGTLEITIAQDGIAWAPRVAKH